MTRIKLGITADEFLGPCHLTENDADGPLAVDFWG